MPNQPCLLILDSPPNVRDTLVDWLLNAPGELIFNTVKTNWHGLNPTTLRLADQVTGQQPKLEFRIETHLETANTIVNNLAKDFPTLGLRYLIIPVIESGEIGLAENIAD